MKRTIATNFYLPFLKCGWYQIYEIPINIQTMHLIDNQLQFDSFYNRLLKLPENAY